MMNGIKDPRAFEQLSRLVSAHTSTDMIGVAATTRYLVRSRPSDDPRKVFVVAVGKHLSWEAGSRTVTRIGANLARQVVGLSPRTF